MRIETAHTLPSGQFSEEVGAVARQLARTPDASRAAIAAAPPDDGAPNGKLWAQFSARAWVNGYHQPAARPARAVPFVPFPAEGGGCDVVRCHFAAGGRLLEIAQTVLVHCVVVKSPAAGFGAGGAAEAAALGKTLFEEPARITLAAARTVGPATIGRQAPAGDDTSIDERDWMDSLWFWIEPGVVVFVMLKDPGRTMSAFSTDPESNRTWFAEGARGLMT